MAKRKSYDKEQLLADHRTGGYTQRQLAKKHKISVAMVNRITKGVEKDLAPLVNTVSDAKAAIALHTEQEVNAISEQIEQRTQHLKFIHNASLKNASVMMKKIGGDTSIAEHKLAQETLNKTGEALGVIDKGGPSINIDNTNAQQNITPQDLMNAIKTKHAVN